MWIVFDNYLDLPSLTQIQGNQDGIHRYMGYVILESMIWFDLIWFDLNRHSKSHWKQHSVRKRLFIWIHCRFTSNKYFFISFHFHFHVLDASALEKVIREISKVWSKNAGLDENSYTIWRKQNSHHLPKWTIV